MSQSQIPTSPDPEKKISDADLEALSDKLAEEMPQILGIKKEIKALEHNILDDTEIPEIDDSENLKQDAA